MEITFPGGVAVNALCDGYLIRTDQPKTSGGEGSAPAPFDLFMASLGTCAGFYALRFCQERQLPTKGLRLTLDWERDVAGHRLSKIQLTLHLPPEFPEKYRLAVIRAVNQCSVKRTILDPPEFEVVAA
jgi:putative redox protein